MPVGSFIPRSLPLDLYAGDGAELRLTVSGAGELDGEVIAEIRAARTDDEPRTAFEVAVDGNVVTLRLSGAQTAELGKFRGAYDVQWAPVAGEPRTLLQGPITCALDVSRNGGP